MNNKEEYVKFLKNEITKTVTSTGFPMKHSMLYFIDNGPHKHDKSVMEYNKGTKNLWVSEELTKDIKEKFVSSSIPNCNENHQFHLFLHECFSEVLGVKIKNVYDVDLVKLIGF